MNKEEILLALLYLPVDDEEKMSPIQIMKSMFLIKNELNLEDSEFYRFKPYLYGPCSFEIYSTLSNLEKKGIIDTIPTIRGWKYYRITNKGGILVKEIIKKMDKQVLDKIYEIKKLVLSKNFTELLEYVYAKYPEYAKNSIINMEVFKK